VIRDIGDACVRLEAMVMIYCDDILPCFSLPKPVPLRRVMLTVSWISLTRTSKFTTSDIFPQSSATSRAD
jgi:hypothetical protein